MGNPIFRRVEMKAEGLLSKVFKNLKRIGSGTYGDVFSGEDIKQQGKRVAIKRMLPIPDSDKDDDVSKRVCIAEISILKHLAGHDNVLSIQRSESDFIVLELMQHDLRGLLNSEHHIFFSQGQVKGYLLQALKGLSWIHSKGVIHRDLKPENILVSQENVVKIADFGMACYYSRDKSIEMPHVVCAAWYRAPELFLGCNHYSFEVDVWSMGCIVGELVADTPILNRHKEEEQMDAVWNLLGTPLENGWPEASNLPLWDKHKPKKPVERNLLDALQSFNKTTRKSWFTLELIDLMDKMLKLRPSNRITSRDALEHVYWTTVYPKPQPPTLLPVYKGGYFAGAIKKV